MHKRVLNVLAISIRRAHRVFERNSKLQHWSNSETLKKYNKSIEKTMLNARLKKQLLLFSIWESLDAVFGFYHALFPRVRTYGTNRLT